jgi:hypothetical protein
MSKKTIILFIIPIVLIVLTAGGALVYKIVINNQTELNQTTAERPLPGGYTNNAQNKTPSNSTFGSKSTTSDVSSSLTPTPKNQNDFALEAGNSGELQNLLDSIKDDGRQADLNVISSISASL